MSNTGDRSTGYRSTGDWSTGDWSTGYRSTGDRSTGDRSTGYGSTGDWSTGDWSTSDYSTGVFSTIDDSGWSIFNKETSWDRANWDSSEARSLLCRMALTEWVDSSRMTDKEKSENETHKTTGGYLKVYEYKEACNIMWDSFTKEEKEVIKSIPNFDANIFKEITGIDIESTKTIIIDGKEIAISEESYNELKRSLNKGGN